MMRRFWRRKHTRALSQQSKDAWQGEQGGRKQQQRARQTVATSQTSSLVDISMQLQQIRATRFKGAWRSSVNYTVA
jgi:hypothetical protein